MNYEITIYEHFPEAKPKQYYPNYDYLLINPKLIMLDVHLFKEEHIVTVYLYNKNLLNNFVIDKTYMMYLLIIFFFTEKHSENTMPYQKI
jgi:hypothetical protein